MLHLTYRSEEEVFKFILHSINKEFVCFIGETTELTHRQNKFQSDELIDLLFQLAEEPPKISEFKKMQRAPVTKVQTSKILYALNFYLLLEDAIRNGHLKNFSFLSAQASAFPFVNVEFLLLEVTAGKIIKIEVAENMDKLFREEVCFGNSCRIICSGLRHICKMEDLDQNTFLFLTNIKETTFLKETSDGMILCGSNGVIFEPFQVEDNLVGERLELEGIITFFANIPRGKVNFLKKDAYRKIMRNFRVYEGLLYYNDIKCLLKGKELKSKQVMNGTVG